MFFDGANKMRKQERNANLTKVLYPSCFWL